jgi:serine/threonine protein kinase
VTDLDSIDGKYEVLEKISEGGMGTVYKVRHRLLDEIQVIKTIRPNFIDHPEIRSRFLREAKIAVGLRHDNIAQMFDFAIAGDDNAYLVMEYVSGATLRDVLETSGPLDVGLTLELARQTLDALGYLHDKNIVHRDVAPDNLMLTTDGRGGPRVKLIDLGIARAEGGPGDTGITQTGVFVGKIKYSAPETFQADGESAATPQSDLYSLGVVLYELLTGRHPIPGNSPAGIISSHLFSPPVSFEESDGSNRVPLRLRELILKALAKKAADRQRSAAEISKEIARLQEGLPPPAEAFRALSLGTPQRAGTKRQPVEAMERCISSTAEDGDMASPLIASRPGIGEPVGESTEAGGTVAQSPLSETLLGRVSSDVRLASPDDRVVDQTSMLGMGFVATGDGAAPPVELTIVRSVDPAEVGTTFPVSGFPCTIGRARSVDVCLARDHGVSRTHAELCFEEGGFWLRDLGGPNGAYVNGRRIPSGQLIPLFMGDLIALSATTALTFKARVPPLPNLEGRVLGGRYALGAELFASIKAVTYRGDDQKLPRVVAVKVLNPALGAFAPYSQELARQAEMAAGLIHPHICKVIDYGHSSLDIDGVPQTFPFLCMDLLSGGNLGELLRSGEPIETRKVTTWLLSIAEALGYAHSKGIIHGGIKPSAIVFDEQAHSYLTDFAFAWSRDHAEKRAVIGAPAFLAPEQWESQEPTSATDQYALATLAYMMVTGSRPHEGQENPEVRARNFRRGPEPAHVQAHLNSREGVGPAVSEVLEKALSVSPEARYPCVCEFVEALKRAFERPSSRGSAEPIVFLSYRRESSAGWPALFSKELGRRARCQTYVDTERRDSAVQFPEKLATAIATCDVFVCFLAEETLASHWVREEIRIAFEHRRPMVPVFQEGFRIEDTAAEDSPAIKALLHYDGVHLLDRRSVHVDHTIDDLATIITQTVRRTTAG